MEASEKHKADPMDEFERGLAMGYEFKAKWEREQRMKNVTSKFQQDVEREISDSP